MGNREIKFRVWSESLKCFKYWGFIQDCFIGPPTGGIPIDDCRKLSEQFTGLLDKTGKEIYEGDIVTCSLVERESYDSEFTKEDPATVTWDDDCAGFFPFIKASQWRSEVFDIEIIGNIHES